MAAWVALWTAILCAMPSGALPASKIVGSAFDPATTSVALKSRSQSLAPQSAPRRLPPSPDTFIPERRAAILAIEAVTAPAPLAPDALAPPPGLFERLRGSAQPRAPPLA